MQLLIWCQRNQEYNSMCHSVHGSKNTINCWLYCDKFLIGTRIPFPNCVTISDYKGNNFSLTFSTPVTYLKQNFVCSCQIPRKNPEPEDEQEIDEEPGDPVPPEGLGNPLGARLPDGKIWSLPLLGLRQGGGCGAQFKERKGSKVAAYRSGAIVQDAEGPNTYDLKIWL